MGQKVDSRIIDRNGFGGVDDGAAVREGGLAAWGSVQVKQLDGESYLTSWYNAAVANAGVLNIRIVTLAVRRVIFNIDARSTGVRMQIYENPTFTANGTLLAAVPPDFGANQAANFAWHTPTVGAVGTLHFDGMGDRSFGDTIFTFQSSASGFSYLVRLTNMSGAANDIAVNLETFV